MLPPSFLCQSAAIAEDKHVNKGTTRSFPLQLPLNHSNFLQSL